jgi:hypothetical protein
MDERVFAEDYVRIWMTSPTVSQVVRQVAAELGFPVTPGEVLLAAQRLRRGGVNLPVRPGGAGLDRLTFVRRLDGDFEDGHGRAAYPVGPGTPVEGPWVCARCRQSMCGGFVVLSADLGGHWPVCSQCVDVTD